MITGVERAFIAEISPVDLKGFDAWPALHYRRHCIIALQRDSWIFMGSVRRVITVPVWLGHVPSCRVHITSVYEKWNHAVQKAV
jgi:hypothetical protein